MNFNGEEGYALDEKEIVRLPISEITPGMITAQDIYSRTDQLIINKNTVLGADSIAKLMFYAIGGIWVYSQPKPVVLEDAYTSVLRSSSDFTQFMDAYDDIVKSVKRALEEISLGSLGNVHFDQAELLDGIDAVVAEAGSSIHIFNMLHCIRDYDDAVFIHSVNAALICNVFGDWLHLEENDKRILTLCGLLHDSGKLLIPANILNKPSKLTEEEYAVARRHPEGGYELLKDIKELDERVLQAVLHHHERYDGSGYPDALSGEQIDPFSCITGIADVYDAMASKRIYRRAICPFDIIKVFEDEGMHQFNPHYLQPLIRKLAETYIHHTVRLSNGSRGEIVTIHPSPLASPVVRVENCFLDLAERTDLKIDAVL